MDLRVRRGRRFGGPSGAVRPHLYASAPQMIAGLVIGLLVGSAAAWLVLRAQYAVRVAALEEARTSLGSALKALAADAIATNNQSFMELAKSQLEQVEHKTTQELEPRQQ